ncbi:MAG: hypothetical protein ACOYY3_05025 [Chloroflexota bacterium]
MAKSKIIRLVLAVLVLGVSAVLLLWAFLPALRETRVLPIPPGELQLPTPEAWLPLLMGRV